MNKFIFLIVGIIFSTFCIAASSTSGAANVSMANFDNKPRGIITPAEFFAAQNAATRRGREAGSIRFGSRAWTASENFNVSRTRVTLIGNGPGSTLLQARSAADGTRDNVINVNASRVQIRNMTIQGGTPLAFATGFLGFGSAIPGNVLPQAGIEDSAILAKPTVGLINGIVVQRAANRFFIRNCRIRRVSTGILFAPQNALDGFICENVNFFTLNTMISAVERRPSPTRNFAAVTTPDPARPFRITNANLLRDPTGPTINRRGDLLLPGRGIELDFGNASFGRSQVSRPVDLKFSVIEDCNMPRVTSWNVALNRVSNITLRRNTFGGGGAGTTRGFKHTLHLEDQCRNVRIFDNDFTQARLNDVNMVIGNVAFAWVGGDNGFPRLNNNRDNTFRLNAPLLIRGGSIPRNADVGDFGSQPR